MFCTHFVSIIKSSIQLLQLQISIIVIILCDMLLFETVFFMLVVVFVVAGPYIVCKRTTNGCEAA